MAKSERKYCRSCRKEIKFSTKTVVQNANFYCNIKCLNMMESKKHTFRYGDLITLTDDSCIYLVIAEDRDNITVCCCSDFENMGCAAHKGRNFFIHRNAWFTVRALPKSIEVVEDSLFPDSVYDAGDLHFQGFDACRRLEMVFARKFEDFEGVDAYEK